MIRDVPWSLAVFEPNTRRLTNGAGSVQMVVEVGPNGYEMGLVSRLSYV